jgi:D-psicose/D-tagatose/L-ribulose 3-epimerase
VRFGVISLTWDAPFGNAHVPLLGEARALGFEGFEIFFESPQQFDVGLMAEAFTAAELTATICAVPNRDRDLSADDPAVRASGLTYLKDAVDIVAGLGGQVVGGPLYGDQVFYGGVPAQLYDASTRARKRSNIVDGLRRLSEYAGSRDVSLAIEPLNRFETATCTLAEHALELVEEVGAPNLTILLDTYHMNIDESSIPEVIRTVGSRLGHFHANENHRGTPGSGHIPWEATFAALRDIDYNGWVVLEPFRRRDNPLGLSQALWRPAGPRDNDDLRGGLEFLQQFTS